MICTLTPLSYPAAMTIDPSIPAEVDDAGATDGQAAPASPELTGGAGFTFEDAVATVYAAALLCETTAPGLPARQVKHVAVQQGSLGHPLDDVIVQGEGADSVRMRLSLQVKRRLVISRAASNADFRETVLRAYDTVTGPDFKVGLDRVGAVTGEIADGSKRIFETLCEWARADSNETGFVKKLRTDGVAGEKERQFDDVRVILSSRLDEAQLDAATHLLLSHFVLMRFEMLHEGSVMEAHTVSSLANCLHPNDRGRADDLWRRLLALVRVAEGQAAAFDRKTLVARLNGAFRLSGAPSMLGALSQLAAEARLAASEIVNVIDGVRISREHLVQSVREALVQHRFVQIGGLPGTGKSVVLRSLVEEALAVGPVLFLKSDRLSGATWQQYATANGFGGIPLEDLLVELAAAGSITVFVDGLDRVEVRQRAIVLDVINTALDSTLLPGWRLVATVRDAGIEPLRTWLPSGLLVNGAPVIDVAGFDDAEALSLAQQKPSLAGLLFGNEQVQAIVRRPFFAGVLIKRHAGDASAPNSEIGLATAWWAGGGYGAEAASAGQRRNTLVALAQAGATTLGRRIQALGLDAQALAELEADGIVRDVRVGQTVQFMHDIYFEWAFLQFLISKGEQWLDVIRQMGEPPVLGRVVELLSQAELKDGQEWQRHLQVLEGNPDVRSQWLRAWMLGPFGLPSFRAHEATYNAAMLAEGAKRIGKLAVWFQAEKTKANASALDSRAFPDLDLTQRLILADALAWPSDVDTWARCCAWLLREIESIPITMRSDVFAVFEVWQNFAADFANPVSAAILALAGSWLADIEARFHGPTFPRERAGWEKLRRGEAEELESRLRAMLLRAGRAYPTAARDYLASLHTMERLPRSAFEQILVYSPVLSEVCPAELVDLSLHVMVDPLPEEVVKRASHSMYGTGISSHDWHSLSIGDQNVFFPSAPSREPFSSLFAHSPHEARRLVRQLANHAITAWRQLHVFDHQHRDSPIPLTLDFPWGPQTFWGAEQQYLWFRGVWGSHAVGSGLMALESWAFREVERGRAVDEVLRETLERHESAGALGVAASLTLEAKRCSEVSLPLITSQRLWRWDIRRSVSDMSGENSLIGFERKDKQHYDIVATENKRPSRRLDLRSLATLCVLRGGDIAAKASAAITAFTEDLPFDYEEERESTETVADHKRTAEIWAEVGKAENYQATPMEDGSGVLIQISNPKAQGPDIDAITQRNAQMIEHFTLLNWVHDCFEKNTLGERLSLEKAIENARLLDTSELFEEAHPHVSPGHQRQGAVAGVAAVALRFGQALPVADVEWAADVCLRAWKTPETSDSLLFTGTILLHHPVVYAARGLVVLLRRESIWQAAQEALLQLSGSEFEQVVVEALGGLLSAWDARPEVAWLALDLAVTLSIVERPSFDNERDQREEQHRRRIDVAIQGALARCRASQGAEGRPLPSMPPAWVPATGGKRIRRGRRGEETEIEWEHPSTDFQWHLLAKVLGWIPVPDAMADKVRRELFLSWCDGLVAWTIERLYPAWARKPGVAPFESQSTDLHEWRRALYRFLAHVSLHQESSESSRRIVEPAAAADDETFGSLMEPYVAFLSCNVMDELVVPSIPLALLASIVPRMLSHDSWRQSSWNDGSLHDAELSRMIRVLFFVDVEKAMGAARFANGDWSDVSIIFPLVEPLLAAHGENRTVTSAFLTMCERAFDSYPVDRFVAQLPMVLGRSDGMPLGWRGTSLPARLAGLIQRFSEKTQPLPVATARALLRALDSLVDMGDRRAAAVQTSEVFKDVRTVDSAPAVIA